MGAELWDRFAEPSPAFSPAPLWWWSGDTVTAERLRWQLERLAAGGVFNVVVMNVAPTSPLYGKDADDPPFMSEAWWQLFQGACRDAQELGVRVWFYDQIGFSGANFQGQVVQGHPEHAGRWLERETVEGDGDLSLECPAGGIPVAAAALTRGELLRVPLDGRVARFTGAGRLMLFHAVERGFDYFSPRACRRLFAMVHGRFEERVGHLFGSVIAGSFQDELPNMPTWSPDFAERFVAEMRYDPLPHLAALWEGFGDDGARFRDDYHRLRGALAERSFFRPLHEWHERLGLLCGFDQQIGAREGEPVASSEIYGDYARTHRWFSAPGSDHHGDAKLHSSLAHHYQRPRVWIESFHTSGWGGTLEETFDWLLPWFGAGANLYNPHATYYSTRAGWWEWAPPATDWRQPYWRHYRPFARAIARLCSALSWGDHACEVGVLYPAATARAALRLDGADEAGRRAEQIYLDLVGRMRWFDPQPGVLNQLARDFDVLDDDSVGSAAVSDGVLRVGRETYSAIVLPGCAVLEARTAERLTEFVDAGGTLIAVGPLPAAPELAARFASGAAHHVHEPDATGPVLEAVPRRVRAPVPTLLRTVGDAGLLFVPAAFPRSTVVELSAEARTELHPWARDLSYRFDPADSRRPMEFVVAGVSGDVQVWEPFSGVRRSADCEPVEGGMRVRLDFADGPCALVAWGMGDRAEPRVAPAAREQTLDGEWDVVIEATLEDEWGDLAAPAGETVEAWELEGGVHATFGPRALWAGPASDDTLPAPGEEAGTWKRAEWSQSRGIHKDRIHVEFLGPSGRVPEEFLDFGPIVAGEAVHLRALVHAERAVETHLAVGAAAVKRAWLDGRPVALDGAGYLATGAVALPARAVALDLRLSATEDLGALRAHFAFVADAAGYARPEWLRPAGEVAKSSVVTFAKQISLPADPASAEVLVGANGPCRLLVDSREVGRQGGFDPYAEWDRDRLQPYDLREHLRAGDHELRLELLSLGRMRPVALLDGIIGTEAVHSGAGWSVSVDGRATELDFRLDQRGDPAHSHAWRRPHPLPEGDWLEPGRGTAAAAAGVRVTVTADLATDTQRLRLTAPPGATEIRVPLAAGCRGEVRVDGHAIETRQLADCELRAVLGEGGSGPRACEITVEPAPGLSSGAVLAGPVAFTVASGRMALVDWQEAGLASHSGGVRYSRQMAVEGVEDAAVTLDLGRVRGTAEVLIDGESAGVRVCSPYTYDLSGRLGTRPASLEVLVLNTLGPHLDAVSPTPYVFPGQRASGLLGPVRLLAAERSVQS
jgi:hypothetical protein